MENISDFDDYFEKQPNKNKVILEKIRQMVREIAPGVREKMGYGIPEFNLNGPLVYIAGFKNHIGLYPTSSGTEAFKSELGKYKIGRGSIQFPIDEAIPYELIRRIIEFRVNEKIKKS